MRNAYWALCMGACTASLTAGEAAFAQEAAPRPPGDVAIGEIVVTAQRRSERLRDVPLTIVAKSGDDLLASGVQSAKDLTYVVPGVKIDQVGSYVQPAMHGVSSNVVGPGTDAPIAIYLDGVVQPNQLANYLDLADIERVEVAMGPQGTLFGRNATGGAISIYTKGPSFTPNGSFSVGYGNYHSVTANAFISGPLVGDVIAGSISALYQNNDGYDYDIARNVRAKGLDVKAIRAKLLFQPTANLSLTLIGAYIDRYSSESSTGIALAGNTRAANDPTSIIATRPRDISLNAEGFLRVKQATVTVRGELELDFGKLTSITGYSDVKASLLYESDRAASNTINIGFGGPQPQHNFSQEITFASRKMGPFSFIAGGYYFSSDESLNPTRSTSTTNPATDFSFETHSPGEAYAGFGEATLELTERLKLVGGIRYSWERRGNSGRTSIGAGVPTGPLIRGPETENDGWTPRASILYKIDESTNIYLTYSQGFKSGGVNVLGFLAPPAGFSTQIFRPERIASYEAGIKSKPLANLSLNLSGFYYDYSDLQVQVRTTSGASLTQNAATANIYGADFAAAWRPTAELSLTAGLAFLDARFGRFRNAVVLRPLPPVAGRLVGNVATVIDASGNVLPRAPDLTATVTAAYARDVGAGVLGLNLTGYYSSKVYFDNDERITQPSYVLLNAILSFEPKGSNFRFEVWGKNLTDKDYIASTNITAASDAVGYGQPRTYGVRIGYKF